MNKRNFKILRLYTISLLCIVLFYFLENSNIIPELVKKSERGRYGDFPLLFLTGLFKYGLFFVGIGIFIILSFLLIKEKLTQNSNTKPNKKTLENAKNYTEKRNLRLVVFHNFGQDEKIISEKATPAVEKVTQTNAGNYDEISLQIISILDEYVKPAVASDGGNIQFASYEEDSKTVNVILQGACSGCPSSTITLKNGIETMLKQMIPNKIEKVIAING